MSVFRPASEMSALSPTGRLVGPRERVAAGVTFGAVVLAMGSLAHLPTLLGLSRDAGDALLASALLLNLALILVGWQRYRTLTREVFEHRLGEERAQALSSRDPLTGMLNRRALIEHGGSGGERRREALAVILINLDGFGRINALQSYRIGDRVIVHAAVTIAAALPPSARLARLGADEFAATLVYDPAYPHTVGAAAAEVMARLAQPFEVDGAAMRLNTSIGIAGSDATRPPIEMQLRRAGMALSAAKQAGGGRTAWFDPAMELALDRRAAIEQGLRRGIPRGEIIPYYEQQIDLASGRLQGFEVLARWQHPTEGLIVPDLFIPVAEACGLISDLSLAVMRRAFEDARDWHPSLTLSVNISPGQLKDPWLAQKIVKLLVETGYPPNRLEVEITESSLFEDLETAQAIVASLKNQGILLALDDFGTGYSSLSHLRALPFDRIKIDKSFVLSMGENRDSAAIVDAIARLGESLGLPITAEGIEDEAILARLVEVGCHKGQGWQFGKPMPVIEARRLLAEHGLLGSDTAVPLIQTPPLQLRA